MYVNMLNFLVNYTEVICGLMMLACLAMGISDIRKGKKDNMPQAIISIGVLFTFIGISYGLTNLNIFDTNASATIDSIKKFIVGMKLAFVTSIAGLFIGSVLKSFQISLVDNKAENSVYADMKGINYNGMDTNSLLTKMNEILTCFSTSEAAVNYSMLQQLQNIEQALAKSSSQQLADKLDSFAGSLVDFQTSVAGMTASLAKMNEGLDANNRKMTEAMESMNTVIENTMNNLNSKFEKMNANIASMDTEIKAMGKCAAASEEHSKNLYNSTMEYQKQSLANENAQIEKLEQNAARIEGMRESFDLLTDNMAKMFSEKLIDALNNTIKDLNGQLKEQFGENFKALNEAVTDLNIWQKEYQATIKLTTEELREAEKSFGDFNSMVNVELRKSVQELHEAVVAFNANLGQGTELQGKMANGLATIDKIAERADVHIQAMQANYAKFDELNDKLIASVEKAVTNGFAGYNQALEKNTKLVNEKFGELANTTISYKQNVEASLEQFEKAVKSSVNGIAIVMEEYKADQAEALKVSNEDINKVVASVRTVAQNLDKEFELVNANVNKCLEQFNKELGAPVLAVNAKMVETYKEMIKVIEKGKVA